MHTKPRRSAHRFRSINVDDDEMCYVDLRRILPSQSPAVCTCVCLCVGHLIWPSWPFSSSAPPFSSCRRYSSFVTLVSNLSSIIACNYGWALRVLDAQVYNAIDRQQIILRVPNTELKFLAQQQNKIYRKKFLRARHCPGRITILHALKSPNILSYYIVIYG